MAGKAAQPQSAGGKAEAAVTFKASRGSVALATAIRCERQRSIRARSPRFRRENLDTNLALVEALGEVAEAAGATTAQVAIAWVLARGADIVPLIGSRSRDRLDEALGALDLELSADDPERIEAAVPADAAAGERYDPAQMALLDSERRT